MSPWRLQFPWARLQLPLGERGRLAGGVRRLLRPTTVAVGQGGDDGWRTRAKGMLRTRVDACGSAILTLSRGSRRVPQVDPRAVRAVRRAATERKSERRARGAAARSSAHPHTSCAREETAPRVENRP